jgi:hypothetical protein
VARLCVSHAGRATSTSGDDQALSGRENYLWRNQLIVPAGDSATLSFSIPEASDPMTTHRRIETDLMDMDGVLVHEERLIYREPGRARWRISCPTRSLPDLLAVPEICQKLRYT